MWLSPGAGSKPSAHRKLSAVKEMKPYEPVREKTNNLGFRLGLTQTRLYSHSIKLEA